MYGYLFYLVFEEYKNVAQGNTYSEKTAKVKDHE